jgi:hypothetical protein
MSTVRRDVQNISCDLQRHLSSDINTDTPYALQHMSPGYISHSSVGNYQQNAFAWLHNQRGNTDNSAIKRKDKRIRQLPST